MIKLEVEVIASVEAEPSKRVAAVFFNAFSIPISSRLVQDRIASKASSIRAEARKLKADVAAEFELAKRKVEIRIGEN